MRARRQSRTPPWERRSASPLHPVGHARRRWPRGYDGGHSAGPRVNVRYRRAFDGDAPPIERRKRSSLSSNRLRNSPVRHGLIGLAIAGVAAPVAINQYQEAMRTDPSHERVVLQQPTAADMLDDRAVMEEWAALAAAETPEMAREAAIERQMERHKAFRITRALAEQILDAAVDQGIDPDVAFGLVRAESSFRNQATSPVGAVGLTQLMPRTAAWMEPGVSRAELRNPERNLQIGFRYLSYLKNKYNGNEDLALLAYNRGPGTVDRLIRQGRNPDNGYAAFVRGADDHGHTLYSRDR
jgi:hypothetical protein